MANRIAYALNHPQLGQQQVPEAESDAYQRAYARVFQAVLVQAFVDACLAPRKNVIELHTRQCRSWLTAPSSDLFEVCDLADIDPWLVLATANRMADDNWPEIEITLRQQARSVLDEFDKVNAQVNVRGSPFSGRAGRPSIPSSDAHSAAPPIPGHGRGR